MSEVIDPSLIRHYEDGIAVFDPVAWRTHVLSRDGYELLVGLLPLAGDCAGDPSHLLAKLCDDPELSAAGPQLEVWAQLACHLLSTSHPA